MTALIFSLAEQQVIVATDTLAMTGDTRTPLFFTSKVYILPHLRGVMCSTGRGDFAADWFSQIQHFLARDLLHLDEYATDALLEIAQKYDFDENKASTIYHFGYSEAEGRYFGFAYRSTKGFKSERLEYGWGTKPGVPDAQIKTYPDSLIEIMERQRAKDNKLPKEKRVFIGGEIQAVMMQGGVILAQTIHRFEDYEKLYDEMCWNLPANQHLLSREDDLPQIEVKRESL